MTTQKRIAIVSPVPTHAPNAGNRVRLLSLADQLRGDGHEVHFFHVQRWMGDEAAMRSYWGDRYHPVAYRHPDRPRVRWPRWLGGRGTGARRATTGPMALDAWFDNRVNRVLRAYHRRVHFEAVMVLYVFFSKAFEAFGGDVLKILETQDVFTEREGKVAGPGVSSGFFSTTADEERRGLERADVILAIQDEEAAFFRTLTQRPVVTVGHLVSTHVPPSPPTKPIALFLASHNPANVDAMHYLMESIWPLVRRACPHAQLLLAGGICKAVADSDLYTKLGWVADAASAYAQARVVVCPIRRGTGLKIKIVEALAHGKPVVGTLEALTGLDSARGRGAVVGETAASFAEHTVSILQDAERAGGMGAAAREYSNEYRDSCATALAAALQSPHHVAQDNSRRA
jgi:hypothetical protein